MSGFDPDRKHGVCCELLFHIFQLCVSAESHILLNIFSLNCVSFFGGAVPHDVYLSSLFYVFFLLSSAVRDDVMEENPAARSSGGPSIHMNNSLLLFLLLPGWLKSCRRRTV